MSVSDEIVTKYLIRLFNNNSEFFVIKGMAEVGKTNFMFFLMEESYKRRMFEHYCGNVEIIGNQFPYEVIKDYQTLKNYCKGINPTKHDRHKIFFFFDEMGKNIPKITPWAKLNVAVLTSLQVLRKYHLTMGGAFIGDSVSDQILSPNYLNAWFDKKTKHYALLHDYRNRKLVKIRDIPKCLVTYDEFADVSFSDKPQASSEVLMKTEIGRIALRISKLGEGETLKDQGINRNENRRDSVKLARFIIDNFDGTTLNNKRVVMAEEASNTKG